MLSVLVSVGKEIALTAHKETCRFSSDDMLAVKMLGTGRIDAIIMAGHLEVYLEEHCSDHLGKDFFVSPIRSNWEYAGDGEALFFINIPNEVDGRMVGSIVVTSERHQHEATFTIHADSFFDGNR